MGLFRLKGLTKTKAAKLASEGIKKKAPKHQRMYKE